ncbi:MAG: hypothetical protein CSA66_03665 [Proteobacteria bacterium]|nr:MAG: hypothetical protein CSA66_03665 [Pseudomonadota bacterium]
MRMARLTLFAVLAAGLFATSGCGDDDNNPVPNDTSTGIDTSTEVDTSTGVDTLAGVDTSTEVDSSIGGDTSECNCGTRECGTFAGCDCGTCTPPEVCNAAGRCEQPGAPMGSFCGITDTCNEAAPDWPGCVNAQCASGNCWAAIQSAILLRDVCTQGCSLTDDQDKNKDGIEDPDTPFTDCNPADIADGPAGDRFVCVNYGSQGGTALNFCTPGSVFNECNSDADCAEGEGCDLTTINGTYNFRCVAKNKSGAWGEAVGLSQSCNSDPAAGPVRNCESGLCFGLGCVTLCNDGEDSVCDTTKIYPDTGCDTELGTCKGKPSVSCEADIDCSGWECGEPRQILANQETTWRVCWPKSCDIDNDCAAGFYCRFFWNGELGDDAALDSSCLTQNPDGEELGEACDDNPNDAEAGAVCANEDLCVGGYCSALCGGHADCADSQRCEVAELPGDVDEDGQYDFVLPLSWCIHGSRDSGECFADAECDAGEYCSLYEIENLVDDGEGGMMLDADAPYLLTGACEPADDSLQAWGGVCTSSSDCQSGLCLGATENSPGFCTKTCAASSECEEVSLGGETANGLCASLRYSWGGDLDDVRSDLYLPVCVLDLSSGADCSTDFTCEATNEACTPNAIGSSPDQKGTVEYLCQALYDPAAPPTPLPREQLGADCDPASDDFECESGICLTDKGGNGYCSAPCKADSPAEGALTCQPFVNQPRKGAYAANAPSFMLYQRDQECTECAGSWQCGEGQVCAMLSATTGYCVPSCTEAADCAAATVTTACSDTTDPFGDAVKGCFDDTATPSNYCLQ